LFIDCSVALALLAADYLSVGFCNTPSKGKLEAWFLSSTFLPDSQTS
jgi:hypothetical protein